MKHAFNLILFALPLVLWGQNTTTDSALTSEQMIASIIKETGAAIVPNTVDVIKQGNPETRVTGIATCMFATMDVLRKAVEKNCNLIIVHEPLYYNHLDKTEQFQQDAVFLEKKKFIEDHNLVVWRFHDYIHRIPSDGIISGMVEKLGWENNRVKDNPYKFSFPKITLTGLLKNLKETFPENNFHVIGDPEMELSNVMYIPGSSGSQVHISQLQDPSVDVVVAGEVPQWETYEYARDAVLQGRKKAVVFIGHINSEEYGMKFCADWLGKFVKGIPIHFIECGSSYWSY
ncbi:Nif3-like dinuclear metal center hexameric protein [Flagellimonas myxillae]|uniref:Nif3-like dinuclear metal center hexameric protein n=1 Tax=Flagellimonas myxillae TaxID=2942214 RepID=UPI00201E8067|nr:Nif3-like dinuclear metal center hexameric protein [Muricauda myxillae]MCL6265855.1 Nif3-like dinuclear metal center hexameric protein [Muricauda myxillae]